MDRRLLRSAAPPLDGRRVRKHDDERGPGASASLIWPQLRTPVADQAQVRPHQPLPHQPEHPAVEKGPQTARFPDAPHFAGRSGADLVLQDQRLGSGSSSTGHRVNLRAIERLIGPWTTRTINTAERITARYSH